MIRMLIADDHKLIRNGYRALLARDKDIEVVGEARDGVEAVELTQSLAPDVVLMDIAMPRLNGLDALKQLKAAQSPARVIVCSMYADERLIRQAIEIGALGYITKDSASSLELSLAIHAVYEGRTHYAGGTAHRARETAHGGGDTEHGSGATSHQPPAQDRNMSSDSAANSGSFFAVDSSDFPSRYHSIRSGGWG